VRHTCLLSPFPWFSGHFLPLPGHSRIRREEVYGLPLVFEVLHLRWVSSLFGPGSGWSRAPRFGYLRALFLNFTADLTFLPASGGICFPSVINWIT